MIIKMIHVVTSEEMKNIDRAAIAGDLNKGFQYMQQAARGLFDIIINRYLELQKQNRQIFITVFAGKGNNGGDGILLAAYLASEGYPVKCFILGSSKDLKNEAAMAYIELEKNNRNNQYIVFINDPRDIIFIQNHLESLGEYNHHFFVDALLGIGSKGTPKEPHATVINYINSIANSNITIFAVDGPSGVDHDTGALSPVAIRAHNTITMGYPKLGSFFYPGRVNYGLTIVNNLGYPVELYRTEIKNNIYFANSIKALIPPRITNGSKYDHGVAALIAGSQGMTGAASLAALAAYRAGLGLLHLISDEESLKTISTNILEIVSHNIDDLDLYKNLIKKHVSVFALGPGLSSSHDDLVQDLVINFNLPMILDADAINTWANNTKKLKQHKHDLLITPHAGEYERLFGKLPGDIKPLDLIQELRMKAQDYSVTILYKGTPTIILDPNGKAFIVPYGNSGLAKAGSGDVLTGLITGLAAQIYTIKSKYPEIRFFYEEFNISALTQAAILGSFLHGKCAELAAKELTEYSIMASDLIRFIPRAIKQMN